MRVSALCTLKSLKGDQWHGDESELEISSRNKCILEPEEVLEADISNSFLCVFERRLRGAVTNPALAFGFPIT